MRAITTYDGELEQAFPPQAITVVLEDEVDLSRGNMLVHPHNVPHSDGQIDVMLVWMGEEVGRPGDGYLVKHTTNTVPAVLTELRYSVDVGSLRRRPSEGFGLNEIGRATIELRRPLLWDAYAQNRATGSIILVDRTSNRTVAAGMIVHREPARRDSYRLLPQSSAQRKAVPANGGLAPSNGRLTPANGKIARAGLKARQKGAVVWLTGLSGSGKSTIARELEARLAKRGRSAYVLDGDSLRTGLCSDLGFSAQDRAENVRRAGEVAALLADAGIIVIGALISPYREGRDAARTKLPEGRFLEVFLDVPLEECERRDPKGLYRRARAGEIEGFTGIDAPYEAPESPELVLPTHQMTLEEAAKRLEALLGERGLLQEGPLPQEGHTPPGGSPHPGGSPPTGGRPPPRRLAGRLGATPGGGDAPGRRPPPGRGATREGEMAGTARLAEQRP